MLAYASHMLAYAGTRSHMLAYAVICSPYASIRWHHNIMLAYASHMLANASISWWAIGGPEDYPGYGLIIGYPVEFLYLGPGSPPKPPMGGSLPPCPPSCG